MLCSFTLFVSSFVSIGPGKTHCGSGQLNNKEKNIKNILSVLAIFFLSYAIFYRIHTLLLPLLKVNAWV